MHPQAVVGEKKSIKHTYRDEADRVPQAERSVHNMAESAGDPRLWRSTQRPTRVVQHTRKIVC